MAHRPNIPRVPVALVPPKPNPAILSQNFFGTTIGGNR